MKIQEQPLKRTFTHNKAKYIKRKQKIADNQITRVMAE